MALNPVAFTEKVVSNFLRYQLTAYPFADARLYAQMRTLLSLEETRNTPLLKGPFVSLSRSFRAGASVTELVADGVLHEHMARLIDYPHVYGHQEKAIRSIVGGQTTLVSTGTGSGKTECFLYPIISRCLQLRDEAAPPGIVAVLVYPMNALAEDQLLRMRGLLAGTGIPFGMYVGKTPEKGDDVAGRQLPPGSSRQDYEAEVVRARDEKRGTAVHPAEERCSREAMRTAGGHPRILLTNVKQMELLLTRSRDVDLFNGSQLQFLVFDEAHTFTGAGGAETACLVRRLRAYCGREPEQTVCIATSATIADLETGGDPGREFASRFFGVDANSVELVGEEYTPDVWADERSVTPAPADPQAALAAALRAVDAEDAVVAEQVGKAYRLLSGRALKSGDWSEALHAELSSNEIPYALADALKLPRRVDELCADVAERLGRPVTQEEALAWLTLGAAARRESRPLLRPVVHAFVRGIDGAVISFEDGSAEPQLWLSSEDAALGGDDQRTRLPVMTCSTCGQHYLQHHFGDFEFAGKQPGGGEAVEDRFYWPPLDPANGGIRAVMFDRLISDDDPDHDQGGSDEDADDPDGHDAPAPQNTAPLHLCRLCGAGHPEHRDRCDGCGASGALVSLLVCAQKKDNPGYLTRCVCCGALGRDWGGRYREPSRPVRAGTVSDVHVLAQEMVQHAERPRLLVFADNRQDAAFQAGWMRDRARRYRLRALMYQRIKEGPVSVNDLVAYMDDLFERDDELSRVLLREVWQVARKEAAGQRHADERRKFLRIQVLRELVTGVKQRVGLEPYGRMRVRYLGLDAGHKWVKATAAHLEITPEILLAGIATMLDQQRRTSHLLDRDFGIFSRFWGDGEREIMYGFLPKMPGVPKGMKLRREGDDDERRIKQWISASGETAVLQQVKGWGVAADDAREFVEELWQFLCKVGVLAPVTLTGSKGGALPKCTGTHQIDADQLCIEPHSGVWRCGTCRRTQNRPTPHDLCMAWRCTGTLQQEAESDDDYDLRLLDQGYRMIRPQEHSAQVPQDERERIEIAFKGDGEAVNCLVSTPTLELGVDIGALDSVLMRNVPPLPANYWQRAGRAGRRHRMAVNLTHCRATSHDRGYFAEPLKLLGGRVEPPSFNLRNPLMIAKHVHAAVLTRLHHLARPEGGLGDTDRTEIQETLDLAFPTKIRDYLFTEGGDLRGEPLDVTPLHTIVTKHEANLVDYVSGIFRQGWPEQDRAEVRAERLHEHVDGTTDELRKVIATLKRRLDWALTQVRRLEDERRRRGTLEPSEDALLGRCDRLVKRLKGVHQRQRRQAAGHDDVVTMSVLAAEGFLPGYGLEVGHVVGYASIPPSSSGAFDFDLPRWQGVAVIEFAPGNLIYANGHRFTPRRFQLSAEDELLRFAVEPKNQAVRMVDAGSASSAANGPDVATMGATTLTAIPVTDVDLSHQSHISDDEAFRFQLPVEVYAHELGRHGEGQAYDWGGRYLHQRRSVHFRLVNIGASSLVRAGDPTRFGFPICTVCGQTGSPFGSQLARDTFADGHQERCGRKIQPTGLYANVVADMLTLPHCDSRTVAFSLAEAIRFGAAGVLDMEREDLRVVVLAYPDREECDAVLYDPMPGGSGLLEQITSRFSEVMTEAKRIAERCPSDCGSACIDCFHTYRNAFYHRHLDRHVILEFIADRGVLLSPSHTIPQQMPQQETEADAAPTNIREARLRDLIKRAGFADPVWDHQVQFGRPLGSTTPDCCFEVASDGWPEIAVYLDGLSNKLHGNPATREKDRQIREELRARGVTVIEIPNLDLDDRTAMQRHFKRLGRSLGGREYGLRVAENLGWYDGKDP